MCPKKPKSGSPLGLRAVLSSVFAPEHGPWYNLVNGFFSKMARPSLRYIGMASQANPSKDCGIPGRSQPCARRLHLILQDHGAGVVAVVPRKRCTRQDDS